MFAVEYRDLKDRERVLAETDDGSRYTMLLLVLASDPDRYVVINASPYVVRTPTTV